MCLNSELQYLITNPLENTKNYFMCWLGDDVQNFPVAPIHRLFLVIMASKMNLRNFDVPFRVFFCSGQALVEETAENVRTVSNMFWYFLQ